MKRLVIAALIALTVSGSTAASADVPIRETKQQTTDTSVSFVQKQTLLNNKAMIQSAYVGLKKTVGKTWYVFSGNTPSGWDCSGLTMWFYGQLGVDLEHRASGQQKAGKATNDPVLGDIVVFKYKGYKSAYHVGIYIGDGKMIHAPRKGQRTSVESVSDFAGDYSVVTYRRVIDTI
jgi:cell wall-associated NlpC family hydrolase